MNKCKNLNLGKVVYKSEFYHVPDSWLLKIFDFIFNGVTRENQQPPPFESTEVSIVDVVTDLIKGRLWPTRG